VENSPGPAAYVAAVGRDRRRPGESDIKRHTIGGRHRCHFGQRANLFDDALNEPLGTSLVVSVERRLDFHHDRSIHLETRIDRQAGDKALHEQPRHSEHRG
jgi:hypothetical protein